MTEPINYTKKVRYECMLGREATEAIAARPIGYLPVGCLERHGDHLPMGLDTLKAHGVCCLLAQALGGVVFPPHYYAGVHNLNAEQLRTYTGQWGNLYTDASAEEHLTDVLRQIERAGLRVTVLYSGHYPGSQVKMLQRVAGRFGAAGDMHVLPFWESAILPGDHAGLSETSLMLYLDRSLVDMTRIGPANYADHGWADERSPEQATAAEGERQVRHILEHVRDKLARWL